MPVVDVVWPKICRAQMTEFDFVFVLTHKLLPDLIALNLRDFGHFAVIELITALVN